MRESREVLCGDYQLTISIKRCSYAVAVPYDIVIGALFKWNKDAFCCDHVVRIQPLMHRLPYYISQVIVPILEKASLGLAGLSILSIKQNGNARPDQTRTRTASQGDRLIPSLFLIAA